MTLTYHDQYSSSFIVKKAFPQLLLLVFIGILSACSPTIQQYSGFKNSAKMTDEHFISSDGVKLRLQSWLPVGEPSAVLLGLHGFNDHSGAFTELGPRLAALGFAVYAYDQRGFGTSERRGIWADTPTLISDFLEVSTLIKSRHSIISLNALGESMGGAVLLAAHDKTHSERVGHIDGIILSAPAIGGSKTKSKWQMKLLSFLAHTLPMVRLQADGLNIKASDNTEMLRALGDDPKFIRKTRIDAIYGLLGLMDVALDAAKNLTKPVLILYGANDELILKEHTCEMIRKLPKGSWRLAFYPNGYHLLFRDLGRDLVTNDIVSWLQKPVNQLPSGFEQHYTETNAEEKFFCSNMISD
tara:strand:+ start:1569 stop:2636 length:1068 start_codon:yes stop_codon:yes gene_type:complete